MNPYKSLKTEPPHGEPDPPEAQLAYHHPVPQRLLALGVPCCAGALLALGIQSITTGHLYWGAGDVVLAALMLAVAWRWTR
jgi:hypothetical protein